jgi:hypothetical protein
MEFEPDGDWPETGEVTATLAEARRRRFRGLGLWRRRARKREQLELQTYRLHRDVRSLTRALHKEREDRAKLIELLGEAQAHITALREEVRRLRPENEPEEEA